jgi:hypothetical protein
MNRQPARPVAASKPSLPLSVLLERSLVGAFAALVVARALAPGNDPGRLRLTSGTGSVSFNLCLFILLFGALLWRALAATGRPVRWTVVPLLFAGVGVAAFISSQLSDRYARPGLYVAWEWIAIAAAAFLARFLVPSVADSRGILNVLLATAVCVAGQAVYQWLSERAGLPTIDVVAQPTSTPLAGDDEFYPELNRPPTVPSSPRGTFDAPETLVAYLWLVLPAALAVAAHGLAEDRARRGVRWGRWSLAIPGLVIVACLLAVFARPYLVPRDSWAAAVELIGRFPFLGVGPGNLSRFSAETVNPPSAWLGLAATTGLVGLGLFIVAVVVAFRAARPRPQTEATDLSPRGTRWEFYLGGVVGLLIGFVWTVGESPAEAPASEVFKLGGAAVLRAVLWFAAFALLETVRPFPRGLGAAALLGVAFALLYGFFTDAPARPTILFPMAVLLGLAANMRRLVETSAPIGPWARPVLFTGAIVAAALAVTYLATAAVPAWATNSSVRQARMASRHYPDLHRQIDATRAGAPRANALVAARNYLVTNIVNPLTDAAERDPNNAALLLEVARWRRPLWEYELTTNPPNAIAVAQEIRKLCEMADHIDPRNLAAKRNLFEAMLVFRRHSTTKEPERLAALNKLIGQIAEREPATEVAMRYRVVSMLLDRRDAEAVESEVTMLLRKNRADGAPHGRLTDEQRSDVIQRAIRVVRSPGPELIAEWTQ